MTDITDRLDAARREHPALADLLVEAAATIRTQRHGLAMQWQPIETAPKDKTRFLATGGGVDRVSTCSWNERIGCWNTPEYALDDTDREADGYNRPTHWMPLPAPPADGGGNG